MLVFRWIVLNETVKPSHVVIIIIISEWRSGRVSPSTGLSHQQVAVRQRHPALQTDGGEVRMWQPLARWPPQALKKHTPTLTHWWRVGRRRQPIRQAEGRLSLRGFHAWMATERTATPLPSARHVTEAMSFISFSGIKRRNAVFHRFVLNYRMEFISGGQCVTLQCGSPATGGQCNTSFSSCCRTSER